MIQRFLKQSHSAEQKKKSRFFSKASQSERLKAPPQVHFTRLQDARCLVPEQIFYSFFLCSEGIWVPVSLSSEFLSPSSLSARPTRVVSACTSSSSHWTRGDCPASLLSSLQSSSASSGPSVTPLNESVQEDETDETFCLSSVWLGTFRLISASGAEAQYDVNTHFKMIIFDSLIHVQAKGSRQILCRQKEAVCLTSLCPIYSNVVN